MIPEDLEQQILRLHFVERWKVGTIAKQVQVHHTTVQRVLRDHGISKEARQRTSIVDPYLPFILETLEKYPTLPASRLHTMVAERGYPGGPDHFRSLIARFRPRKAAEAYQRIRTLCAEEAQVDWGHFGKRQVGNATRTVSAFVMVLSWSRMPFVWFFFDQRMGSFLTGHVLAFEFFEGVPRRLLYDNLKSVVLERRRDAIRFHTTLLDLAGHYRFEPRPVAIARGNEKGRVERTIRYLRTSFWPAREWTDLDDLNRQALDWCRNVAAIRKCPGDRTLTVQQAWEEERPKLLPLPDDAFPAYDRVEVKVSKQPYVRYDRNDYSVPHHFVRRTLVVWANSKRVRIMNGDNIVAEHTRTFDKGAQVEDPAHLKALKERKQEAREGRGIDRLHHAAPNVEPFLEVVARRGHNLGSAVAGLLRLLDTWGTERLTTAIREATEGDSFHVAAVRQILEVHHQEAGKKPPISIELPDNPKVRDIEVKPHDLASYDKILGDSNDDTK